MNEIMAAHKTMTTTTSILNYIKNKRTTVEKKKEHSTSIAAVCETISEFITHDVRMSMFRKSLCCTDFRTRRS